MQTFAFLAVSFPALVCLRISPICPVVEKLIVENKPMRMDKLTSKFQMALADAQSIVVGRDHQFIEPVHLMLALLDQQGGCLLYTSPSPRDDTGSRMPSSA